MKLDNGYSYGHYRMGRFDLIFTKEPRGKFFRYRNYGYMQLWDAWRIRLVKFNFEKEKV